MDDEMCQLDCAMFEESTDKPIECRHCQIRKYGGIKLMREIKFEECSPSEYKF